MSNKIETLSKIQEVGIVAVVRATSIEQAEKIKSSSTDYIIKNVTQFNTQFNSFGGLDFIADDGRMASLELSRFALGQLGTKIHVPGQYIENCLNAGFNDLAKQNVNAWIPKYDGGFMLRETDNHLRAVLSPRYSVYDSEKLACRTDSPTVGTGAVFPANIRPFAFLADSSY